MRTYTVEFYKDADEDWRWRMVASNGKIVADSGEGYKRRGTCVKQAHRLFTEHRAGTVRIIIKEN